MLDTTYFDNAQDAFERLYDHIKRNGVKLNNGTTAVFDVMFKIIRPCDRAIETPWRKWSKTYAEREWQWYLSGDRSVAEIKKHAKLWDKMHGGDNLVNSNYGWQWLRNGQLEKCIEQLKNDPLTRQAWISIYDGKEKDSYAFDTPCTLAVGFSINPIGNYLNMTVMMRSNDLVYGFCNDQYCFSKLQEMVAKRLGLPVGIYTHIVQNLHIYDKHLNLK